MNSEQRWEASQAAHAGTIRTFAHNHTWQVPGFDKEDIEQELLVVLWRCATQYDPDKGATFNVFFQQSCKNRIISLARQANSLKRKVELVSLEETHIGKLLLDQHFNEDEMLHLESVQEVTSPSAESLYLAYDAVKERAEARRGK